MFGRGHLLIGRELLEGPFIKNFAGNPRSALGDRHQKGQMNVGLMGCSQRPWTGPNTAMRHRWHDIATSKEVNVIVLLRFLDSS